MRFPLVFRSSFDAALRKAAIALDDNLRLNLNNSDLRLKIANLEGSNKGLLEINADLEKRLKQPAKKKAKAKKA